MKRRLISALSIMAYLAGTFAAVPHAHAGARMSDHAGHGAGRHVHASWFGHHSHHHGHGHDSAEHQFCSHSHHGDEPNCSIHREQSAEHDQDAIYLPDEVGAAATTATSVAPVEPAAASLWIIPAANVELNLDATEAATWQIAEDLSIGCPLYLALRALRI